MFILNGVSEMLHGQLRLNYEILRIPIAAVAHCRATGWAARSADLLWNFASGYFLGRMTPSATNSHNQQLNTLVAAASVVCVDHFLYGCNAKTVILSWRDASENENV